MHYLGGKARLAHRFTSLIQAAIDEPTATGRFVEPFVGGFNVVPHLRFAQGACSDRHPGLVSLYRAVQDGWHPPAVLPREEYEALKAAGDWSNPLSAFAAFGVSFSGLEWGSYVESDEEHPYCRRAGDALLEKARSMRGVGFEQRDYRDVEVYRGDVLYCDPPYLGTLGYGGRRGAFGLQDFEHEEFYDWVEAAAERGAAVFVSEFTVPWRPGWETIWELERKISVDNKSAPRTRVDRLARVWPASQFIKPATRPEQTFGDVVSLTTTEPTFR